MLSTSSKRNTDRTNYSDPQSGQTLFQFLKRKKKAALHESISSAKNRENDNDLSVLSRSYVREKEQRQKPWVATTPSGETKRDRRESMAERHQNPYNSKTKREHRYQEGREAEGLTPRKVTFVDSVIHRQERDDDKRPVSRSFIQLISPFRKKISGNPSRSPTPQIRTFANETRVSNSKQHYARKNLNQKITQMKDTIHSYMQTGKNVKQKAHIMLIELKPLLKFVEQNAPPALCHKSQEMRSKLRTFQVILKPLTQLQHNSSSLETFHRCLSQHLSTLQGELRAQFEKKDISTSTKVRQIQDTKITQLEQQNTRLRKQVEILQRKLEKNEQGRERLQGETLKREQQYVGELEDRITIEREKSEKLEDELETIRKNLQDTLYRQRQLQKALKEAVYSKQDLERRFREEADKIKSSKEQYLLNQIMMMKKEFQTDMAQMTSLQNKKELDLLQTVRNLQRQLAENIGQRQQEKLLEDRLVEETNLAKTTANKFRRQNQCLVTDMTRMNEELYQHWLALKDVKTLANRLQIFGKFIRIYDDLAFNDHLFG